MLMFHSTDRRMGRIVAGMVLAGVFLFAIALVAQADPPEPTGACCLGRGVVLYAVTQADCQVNDSGYIWIQGNFDPTADVTPCDLMPGGD